MIFHPSRATYIDQYDWGNDCYKCWHCGLVTDTWGNEFRGIGKEIVHQLRRLVALVRKWKERI